MPLILQYLAYKNGFNPSTLEKCDINNATEPCNINWITGNIPISSMLLYVQAIAFSLQMVLLTTFGSLADYGRWNRYVLLVSTVLNFFFQALPMTLINDDGRNWNIMMGLMTVGLISYGTSLAFYAAVFPTISDNLPQVREKGEDNEKWRNHVSAISTTHSNIGFLVVSGILSGVSFVPYEGDSLGNKPIYNFIGTMVCATYAALTAIPYFVLMPKNRKGPDLPLGYNYLTIGWKSIVESFREAKKLRYLFTYMVAYFMFSDGISTLNQMIVIVQGQLTNFSPKLNVLFGLLSAVTSIMGCLLFLWLTEYFKLKTKTSLLMIMCLSSVIPLWGSIGIFSNNFGLKSINEMWVLNIWGGLFVAPIWAWQQTLLAEMVPKGKENLFFGLFGIVSKASSWIGPVVIGAITEATSDIWRGWPFVLGLFAVAITIVVWIDVDDAKKDACEYVQRGEGPTKSQLN
ncbi:autophagy-related protein 22-like protein [Sporodiniella umbellata]|nr:autophagy-related protein 22-like protein [Sporodiniella umbellata]